MEVVTETPSVAHPADENAEEAQSAKSETVKALEALVNTRRSLIESTVASVLEAFSEALAAGKIKLAEDAKTLENIVVKWAPPEGWHMAHQASLKALANRTKMTVSWNGCLKCPVWLRPRPPVKAAPVIPKEKILGAIRGLNHMVTGKEVSTGDQEAIAGLVGPVFGLLQAFGGAGQQHGAEAWYGGRGGHGLLHEPCEHQQPHATYVRHSPYTAAYQDNY